MVATALALTTSKLLCTPCFKSAMACCKWSVIAATSCMPRVHPASSRNHRHVECALDISSGLCTRWNDMCKGGSHDDVTKQIVRYLAQASWQSRVTALAWLKTFQSGLVWQSAVYQSTCVGPSMSECQGCGVHSCVAGNSCRGASSCWASQQC